MKFRTFFTGYLLVFVVILFSTFSGLSQGRERVVSIVQPEIVEPTKIVTTQKQILPSPKVEKRKPIDQKISIVGELSKQKTTANLPTKTDNLSESNFNQRLQQAIDAKLGIPYRYGSTGPSSFDCSGLVWSVFQSAGNFFERTSAGSYWQNFDTVSDDEKYRFGTLVFFNKLGHVGIVANENGFYHASSSKGVTYSPFEGYWEKRIVGFRRIPMNSN
jgi:cell wall-associated NlpC family hydrolase